MNYVFGITITYMTGGKYMPNCANCNNKNPKFCLCEECFCNYECYDKKYNLD